jgi:hypothetical protein
MPRQAISNVGDWVDGVSGVWRRRFKLRAKRQQEEISFAINSLQESAEAFNDGRPHAKFAIRPLHVRRTQSGQRAEPLTAPGLSSERDFWSAIFPTVIPGHSRSE